MTDRNNGVQRARVCVAGIVTLGDALLDALSRAADGVFVSDAEGRVVFWNAAAEAIWGYRAGDVLGRPCRDLFRGRDADGDANGAAGWAGGDRVPAFDVQARTKAGLIIWLNVSVLVVGKDAGLRLHLVRDVTFAKEQLALAHEGLAAASRDGDGAAAVAGALTRREREVLGLMGKGLNTASMAERLHLSRATVRNHVQNILLKLGVHSRLEAVAHGLRHRLL